MRARCSGKKSYAALLPILLAVTYACGTGPKGASPGGEPASGSDANGTKPGTGTGGNAATPTNGNVVLGAGNVQLLGSGFEAYEGNTVRAVVVTTIGRVVGGAKGSVVNGAFGLQLPVQIADGYDNEVAYFLDTNGNGTCNVAPADVAGVVKVPADGVGRVQPAKATALSCAPFGDYDLDVVGKNFATGANVSVAVVDTADGGYVAGPLVVPVATSQWTLRVPNLLRAGRNYVVQAYRDADGTGRCKDPGWAKQLGNVQANTQALLDAPAAGARVCEHFP